MKPNNGVTQSTLYSVSWGPSLQGAWEVDTNVTEKVPTPSSCCPSNLNMETVCYPKLLVLTYQTTRCHGLASNNLNTRSHERVNMQAQSTSKPTARQGSSVIPNCCE